VGAAAARQKVVPTANRENFAVKMAMDTQKVLDPLRLKRSTKMPAAFAMGEGRFAGVVDYVRGVRRDVVGEEPEWAGY
jgi:hypothetical protein